MFFDRSIIILEKQKCVYPRTIVERYCCLTTRLTMLYMQHVSENWTNAVQQVALHVRPLSKPETGRPRPPRRHLVVVY